MSILMDAGKSDEVVKCFNAYLDAQGKGAGAGLVGVNADDVGPACRGTAPAADPEREACADHDDALLGGRSPCHGISWWRSRTPGVP